MFSPDQMKTGSKTAYSDQTIKPRRPKSREVSSRYLSPSSTVAAESGIPSPNHPITSPSQKKPGSSSTDSRKKTSHEDRGSIRRLWPSSTPITTGSSNKKSVTVPIHDKSSDDLALMKLTKENHKPFFGGSMRYTGKLLFSRRSSNSNASANQSSALPADHIVPGRFSVDETALRRRSFDQRLDSLSDNQDAESDFSDINSVNSFGSSGKSSLASYMAPTESSRKSGIEVSSKYKQDRPRNIPNPLVSSADSPKMFKANSAVKKANSLTANGKKSSTGMLSPGRLGSPPVTVENKGQPVSYSSFKPPTSPSRAKASKGVGNLLLDLFRNKKGSENSSSSSSSNLGVNVGDSVHQLRLTHNRLVQWRHVNAKVDAANWSIANQSESNLVFASNSLTKLQHSVLQKKLQLEKQKLEMKLNFIIHSQMKSLEAWEDIEREHLSAISMAKESFHSVICRVPLVEGAKMDPHSASIALGHASDLAISVNSMLHIFSPEVEKTVSILSELAKIAAQEKALLEEFLEHFKIILTLEIQERSLKCSIVQMISWQQQQHLQLEITS